MTREDAIKKLIELRVSLNCNPHCKPEVISDVVVELINIYIADLQADDRNNGADND